MAPWTADVFGVILSLGPAVQLLKMIHTPEGLSAAKQHKLLPKFSISFKRIDPEPF